MECPKCKADDVRENVPAISKANVCRKCGWIEVTAVTLESGMNSYERMNHPNIQQETRTPPMPDTCVLCGKDRDRLNSEGVKLILGLNGGVCVECVGLCQDIISTEGAKAP